MPKPHFARDLREAQFVRGVGPAVQAGDGAAGEARGERFLQFGTGERLVQRDQNLTLGSNPLPRFDHAGGQLMRLYNVPREDIGPRLIPDLQQVAEALGQHHRGRRALALQQRIGGHRCAHLHGRDIPATILGEDRANSLNRCVVVTAGVLGQQLARQQAAVRRTCNYIGKRAAAIDPEMPAIHRLTVGSRNAL